MQASLLRAGRPLLALALAALAASAASAAAQGGGPLGAGGSGPAGGRDPVLDAASAFVAAMAAVIDETQGATVEPLTATFSDEIAAVLPPKQVASVLGTMRDGGAVRARLLERRAGGAGELERFAYELRQDASAWTVLLSLDGEGRVHGWFNRPGALPRSRAALVEALADLPGDWGLALALLGPDGQPLEEIALSRGRSAFPLGSVFKLYVLAELARQASEGAIDLDGTLVVRDELKSLPSGSLHTRPAGHELTVREAAQLMIAISDNTATDHLLALVGREEVEQRLALYRNSVPERNAPFLSTREMFLVKGCGSARRRAVLGTESVAETVDAWLAADRATRAGWLRALDESLAELSEEEWRGTLIAGYGWASLSPALAEIEWFARPSDVVALIADAHRGELVDAQTSRTFLELYAQGSEHYPSDGVREQGFKGGSETGIYVLSARVVADDGRAVLAVLARSRLSVADYRSGAVTSALFNSWIRCLLEGDPEPAD